MYKKKNRLSSKGLLTILILIFVFTLTLVIVRVSSSSKINISNLSFSNNIVSADTTEDGVILIEVNNILNHVKSDAKKPNWSAAIAEGNTKLASSRNFIIAYSEHSAEVFDGKGKSLFIIKDFPNKIERIVCGFNNFAILATNDTLSIIHMYNSTGEEIDVIEPESRPLDLGFYLPNDNLWVLTINTDVTMPISTITSYNVGQAIIGRMSITDQLVEKLFFDDSNIYICTTNDIIIYDHNAKETSRHQIYGYKVEDFKIIDSKPTFLLTARNSSEDKTRTNIAKLFEPFTNKEIYYRMASNNISSYLTERNVIFVATNQITQYSLNGKTMDVSNFEINYVSANKIGNTHCLVSDGSAYSIISLT